MIEIMTTIAIFTKLYIHFSPQILQWNTFIKFAFQYAPEKFMTRCNKFWAFKKYLGDNFCLNEARGLTTNRHLR